MPFGGSGWRHPARTTTTTTLAHIKLSGSLNEAPVATDPLFGTGAENFKTKLDRIKKARNIGYNVFATKSPFWEQRLRSLSGDVSRPER